MEFEKSFFSAFKYLCVKLLELLDQPILFVFIKYYIYIRLKKSANMYWTFTIKPLRKY